MDMGSLRSGRFAGAVLAHGQGRVSLSRHPFLYGRTWILRLAQGAPKGSNGAMLIAIEGIEGSGNRHEL